MSPAAAAAAAQWKAIEMRRARFKLNGMALNVIPISIAAGL